MQPNPYSVEDFPGQYALFVACETIRRRHRVAALLGIEDPKARSATLAAEVLLCKRDPIYRAEQYGWVMDPNAEDPNLFVVPFVPWPEQRRMIRFAMRHLVEKKVAVFVKGRKMGATWTLLHLIYGLFCEEKGFRAKLGSRKEELVDGNADSMFAALRFLHAQQPPYLKPILDDKSLQLTNVLTGGEIAGEATNAGFGRGGRRRILLLDEFPHILPVRMQSEVWASITSVANTTWALGTPKGPRGKFHRLYETLPADSVFQSDWRADPRRPSDFRETTMIAEGLSPEEFEQEYEGKFVTLRTGRVFPDARQDVFQFNDETPEFLALDSPLIRFPLVGGWDFGSGPSDLVCLIALLELRKSPRLWLIDELSWNQASWRIAAADVRQLVSSRGYKGREVHYGDPAGIARESDQESWETNLRSGGVPLNCLDAVWNTRDGIEWSLKMANTMLADGGIRVHRRCVVTWDMLKHWTRDIDEGVEVAAVNRAYIPPRHDGYSHAGHALRYLVAGVLASLARGRKAASRERAINEPRPEQGYATPPGMMEEDEGLPGGWV